jgi:hypothetical protein
MLLTSSERHIGGRATSMQKRLLQGAVPLCESEVQSVAQLERQYTVHIARELNLSSGSQSSSPTSRAQLRLGALGVYH